MMKSKIEIRKAKYSDLDALLGVYQKAREIMRNTGNPTQWSGGYPQRELLEEDISLGRLFVVECDGVTVGSFVFFIGEDPVYARIEQGEWKGKGEYGVLHKVASNGSVKGLFSHIYNFAKSKINYLRIDTHQDNVVMQKVLDKHGFIRAGIVYMPDGSPRIAYENF